MENTEEVIEQESPILPNTTTTMQTNNDETPESLNDDHRDDHEIFRDATRNIKEAIEQVEQNRKGSGKRETAKAEITNQLENMEAMFNKQAAHVQNLKLEFEKLKEEMKALKESISNKSATDRPYNVVTSSKLNQPAPLPTTKPPPAAAARATARTAEAATTSHIAYVIPTEKAKSRSYDQTKSILKSVKAKVAVKKLGHYRGNGILVECRSAADVCALEKALEGNELLSATVPKKKPPTFTFLFPGGVVPQDMNDIIKAQNNFQLEEDQKFVVFHESPTLKGNTIVTLGVPPQAYKQIIDMRCKLIIDYEQVKLREQDPTLQCRNCGRFNHKAANCKYTVEGVATRRCVTCSGDHKYNRKCEETPKCCNCTEHNEKNKNNNKEVLSTEHKACSDECPLYSNAKTAAKQLIDYGQC